MQAHALLALCRMTVAPTDMKSLATIGTAMEIAGCCSSGSAAHVLGCAALLVAAEQAWGEDDRRVEGAARGLLEVSNGVTAMLIVLLLCYLCGICSGLRNSHIDAIVFRPGLVG